MLTLSEYRSICLSAYKAKSTPTSLFTMAAAHAGGRGGAQSRQSLRAPGGEGILPSLNTLPAPLPNLGQTWSLNHTRNYPEDAAGSEGSPS